MSDANKKRRVAGGILNKAFFVTIPHSGENVPVETPWLAKLPEVLLMCDVDRFVDQLYAPVIKELELPSVKTDWHRYAVDLNRFADDVDADSVIGHKNPPGKYPRGLHWSITTKGEKLTPGPMPQATHDQIIQKYFEPFHHDVREVLEALKEVGAKKTYHIDLHSMPSLGTKEHRDPGQTRADIVVSDNSGVSCDAEFKDLVIQAYKDVGFTVAYNWPYLGGRVTEAYGSPKDGRNSIQVELNRALYMNEETKRLLPEKLVSMQNQLKKAIEAIYSQMPVI